MALQLYVKLQTPTIELVVKAKDASGTKDSLTVGFKRYEAKESAIKLNELSAILKEAESEDNLNSLAITNAIKDEIVYLKAAKLDLFDSEKNTTKELLIQDTRTAKPVETLWEDVDGCLDVLLDLYLMSAPYRVSLLNAMQRALFNNDYSDAEVKN